MLEKLSKLKEKEASELLLYSIIFICTFFIVWANIAELDERVLSSGKVIPASQVQDIQNLEGGILKTMSVSEGDIVQKEQILLELDDTNFKSDFDKNQSLYFSYLASINRLEAESMEKNDITFSKEISDQSIKEQEKKHFKARTQEHKTQKTAMDSDIKILQEKKDLMEPLVKKGVVSKLKFLDAKEKLADAVGKKATYLAQYKSEIHKNLSDLRSKMQATKVLLKSLKDRMERTVIKSPVYGVVNKINIDTIGGIAKPGENIMEVVPLETLLLEGKLLPSDVAFIKPGQPARIQLTAYDPTVYGDFEGIVKYVSMDTIASENPSEKDQQYYKILIEFSDKELLHKGKKLDLIPGMQASINILTGKKTVMDYLLKPILKAKREALKER